jgi:hypothetical protein
MSLFECPETGADMTRVVPEAERAAYLSDGDLFTSHFATCPNAAKHRRPR